MKKVKIGIIIDRYHLKYKVSRFLKYLKSKANVNLYIEESYLLNSSNIEFDEDIFFVKGKGKIMLNLAKLIEKETSIPVINPSMGIWLTMNRFLNSLLLRKAGILVPDFSLNPSNCSPPFEDYIIKNIVDQKTYAFKGKIEKVNGHLCVSDQRALKEANEEEAYHYLYYQQFLKSKWEYKVYAFGDNFFFYKQIPVLINPNKIETRRKIDEIPKLKEIAIKAMKAINLKIVSIDFLNPKNGQFYLTDINSLPNFNYIEDGYKKVADFLIEQAKN